MWNICLLFSSSQNPPLFWRIFKRRRNLPNEIFFFLFIDIWGAVTPHTLLTENTSLCISVTIIKLWNIKEWFVYLSFSSLKHKKRRLQYIYWWQRYYNSKNLLTRFLMFFLIWFSSFLIKILSSFSYLKIVSQSSFL